MHAEGGLAKNIIFLHFRLLSYVRLGKNSRWRSNCLWGGHAHSTHPSITFRWNTGFILLEWIRFFCVICIPSPHGNCLWLTQGSK